MEFEFRSIQRFMCLHGRISLIWIILEILKTSEAGSEDLWSINPVSEALSILVQDDQGNMRKTEITLDFLTSSRNL